MRRTKAETGKSPLTLLQHAREDKVKQLLLATSWGLERITGQVGYSDPTTFSRFFPRVVGETPARFRRIIWRINVRAQIFLPFNQRRLNCAGVSPTRPANKREKVATSE